MSKYLGSISIPMNLRPKLAQATPVVPLPMKGSRINAALGINESVHSMTLMGFCVGCPMRSAFVAPMECEICCAVRSSVVHASSKCPIDGGASGLNQDNIPRHGGSL